MLKDKSILLINTGSLKKRFVLQKLKKMGIGKIVVVNAEKNWASHYVDDWVLVDTNNHDLVLKTLSNYLQANKIDGALTFWEDDVLLTSKIVDKFGFIGTAHRVAKLARNKYEFRSFCAKNNLPFPKYALVGADDDLAKVAKSLTFPVVVKPVLGSSSAYVVKADDYRQLKEICEYIISNISNKVESALQDNFMLMIEEYIDGDEVDINMLVQNGKIKFASVSDNLQTKEPFFLETGYALPSTLPAKQQQELIDMAEIILEKMGVMNGCIHYEAKYGARGSVPIEVNLRLGGDEAYPAVKKVWGVDLIEGAVKIAVGEYLDKIPDAVEPKTYVASEAIAIEQSGVISSIDIPAKFPKDLQVAEFHFDKEVGDSVFSPPDDFSFLGWLMTIGDNHNDARENLESATKQFSYEIVPFSGLSVVGKTNRSTPFKAASIKSSQLKKRAKIEKIRFIDKKNQRYLKIGIACNTYETKDGAVEAELSSVGKNIQATLQERGYQTSYIDFNNLDEALSILKKGNIDLIFNVGERLNNSSLLEPHIASFFDVFQIPYTGSNPFTLSLAIDKIRVKKLLTYHNIPTAKWDYAYHVNEEIRKDLKYPLIVKPGNTDNSIGISNESVVTNARQLKKQLAYVIEKLQSPALVEEYLEGDEYDVPILGSEEDDLTVLPLSRTIFDQLPTGLWHICPFDFKFAGDELYKKHLVVQEPVKNVSKKLVSLITEIALDTYNILDCHDYGRVEIKLDRDGNPHVLELNPNPSINRNDCLPRMAKLLGLDYGDFLEKIIAYTIKRYQNKTPYYHLQTTIW